MNQRPRRRAPVADDEPGPDETARGVRQLHAHSGAPQAESDAMGTEDSDTA